MWNVVPDSSLIHEQSLGRAQRIIFGSLGSFFCDFSKEMKRLNVRLGSSFTCNLVLRALTGCQATMLQDAHSPCVSFSLSCVCASRPMWSFTEPVPNSADPTMTWLFWKDMKHSSEKGLWLGFKTAFAKEKILNPASGQRDVPLWKCFVL